MKLLGITQRVEKVENYAERRDCLDQSWSELALHLHHLCIPLPNIPQKEVEPLFNALGLDAIVFSGGNTISSLDPLAADAAPERDGFEYELLRLALIKKIPVIGVCRGMQMINLAFGGHLIQVDRHVATQHAIYPKTNIYEFPVMVNSYHKWGINPDGLANELEPLAVDAKGNIEAYKHREAALLGLMWHPERVKSFDVLDIQLITRFLK